MTFLAQWLRDLQDSMQMCALVYAGYTRTMRIVCVADYRSRAVASFAFHHQYDTRHRSCVSSHGASARADHGVQALRLSAG